MLIQMFLISVFGLENRINRYSDYLGTHFYNQHEQFRTVNGWFMPRLEFSKFDGNPSNYTLFIISFERYVESKISDNKLHLCYLVQHCKNTVKRKD